MKNLEPVCFSRSFYKNTGILLLIIVLASCGSGLYVPTLKDSTRQNVSLEKLNNGRNLYVKSCGSCHNLYLPSRYTKREWNKIVDEMKVRSKIDNMQVTLIKQYLELSDKKE